MTSKKYNQPKKALTHLLAAEILSNASFLIRQEQAHPTARTTDRIFRAYIPYHYRYEVQTLVRDAFVEIFDAGTRYKEPYKELFHDIASRIEFQYSTHDATTRMIHFVFSGRPLKENTE